MNPTKKEQQQQQQHDLFDTLPDEIVLSIFKKLQDAKSLCLSMSVCKRFHSIAPQIDQIHLTIPHKKSSSSDQQQQQIQKGFFKNFVTKALIFKPLQFISQIIKSKSKIEQEIDSDFQLQPNEALKSFEEIRDLRINLPCHESQNLDPKKGEINKIDHQSSTFLKWKAEFGREFHSCVILGAKSLTVKKPQIEKKQNLPESRTITDDELKLRIVWSISCLIAASARHNLIRETLKQGKMIESVVISDESEQGRVCMNRKQIEEFRAEDETTSFLGNKMPDLRMKMWYLEKLELSGRVMEGATLVVIRPAASAAVVGESEDVDTTAAAFGGGVVEEEVVRKLMVAKKCYTLEMNSF